MGEFTRPYFKSSLFEFWGGDFKQLNDPDYFKQSCSKLFDELGISVIEGPHISEFEPQGLSLVATFKESHGGFHTWPEFGYARGFFEVCSPNVDLGRLPELISHYFKHEAFALYDLSSIPFQQRSLSSNLITATLSPFNITHHPRT